jgi:hypothetical protein
MGYNKIMSSYYSELTNLVFLLEKYVNSYRLLIGGAGELNGIALAKKNEVKDALKRVDKVGDLIDDLIDILECCQNTYLNYVRLKSDVLIVKTEKDLILTEIDNELLFQNNTRGIGPGENIRRRGPGRIDIDVNVENNDSFPLGFLEDIGDNT